VTHDIETYFKGRVEELKRLAKLGDPWVFLCASSFIEYLAKITLGRETTQKDYKDFLRDYFFRACPEYDKFTYADGDRDLAVQMYHVLRCGIVHSFSLIPDQQAKGKGGRDRSIILAHRASGRRHLTSYGDGTLDSVVFVAEDFVADIETVTNFIFTESSTHPLLRLNIETWWNLHPPIGVLLIPD
jgi:hypothetical protein